MVRHPDSNVLIKDMRQNEIGPSILDQLRDGLHPQGGGEKRLPTLLLYNEKGLKLFEELSFLDEDYLTDAEIEVLQTHATTLAAAIPEGYIILELGSGNLRKVEILLDVLKLAKKRVDYYALDLSEPELQRTLSAVPKHYQYVRYHGLLGTDDDGLDCLKRPENAQQPNCILSPGSSIGNFGRQEAASFLQGSANTLRRNDVELVGTDTCQDRDKFYRAYNDHAGKTHKITLHGLPHSNRLLGKDVFKLKDWKVLGDDNEAIGRNQAFYSPPKDLVFDGAYLEAGGKVRVEESSECSFVQLDDFWRKAGVVQQSCFGNSSNDSHLHVLARLYPAFSLHPSEYAAQPVPSLDEFKQLWSAWDLVTRHMIPEEDLLSKPIKLRNCCIFYLGHIPTFLDIHLTKATSHTPTEPRHFHTIFERGIDPDVDNPEKCHAHSEIPDEWPPLAEILTYQARVRTRVEYLLGRHDGALTRKVEQALWLGFEHEAMHLETLLYMLLQSDRTVPPPGPVPDFKRLAQDAQKEALPNEWIKIPSATLTVGIDSPRNDAGSNRYFGWDNEKPARQVHVRPIEAKARPLTNEDYARYLIETGRQMLPTSWSTTKDGTRESDTAESHFKNGNARILNGHSLALDREFLQGKSVKTVYGPIALEHALAWPVIASYDELAGCAKWMGGRIPTADEVRNIYYYADINKTKDEEKVQAKKISAVNGHLSNNGVEETPPSAPALNASSAAEHTLDPKELFANLEGCNVGFHTFHPTPITQFGNKLCGRGEMGGVWEWTSSTLEEHEGFQAMDEYPGYTVDFFDGKHNIVLGGSWATHPRLAGRKSFVNWYQRNYPYAWAGARLVRDWTGK